MLTTETKTIDDLNFETTQLAVKDARAVLIRLTRVMGPALAALAGDGAAKLGDLDHMTVANALAKFTSALSEDDLEYFCDKFGRASKVEVGPNMIVVAGAGEQVFRGKLATMFKWLWFCIEVNYSDFISGAGAALAPLTAPKTVSVSTSPQG